MARSFTLPARATDANNKLVAGAKAYFYASGTVTPLATYASAALTTPNANPVVADASGMLPGIFLDPSLGYRCILKTASGATIMDIDPLTNDAEERAARIAGDAAVASSISGVLSALAALTTAGAATVTKDTQAHLYADLAHAADTVALVYGDSTPSKNDIYVKSGASGSGSWSGPLGLFTAAAQAAVAPQVTAAAASAAAAAASAATLGNLDLVLGVDPTTGVMTETLGLITYTNEYNSSNIVYLAPVIPRNGRIPDVSFSITATDTVEIWLIRSGQLNRHVTLASLAAGDHVYTLPAAWGVQLNDYIGVRGYALSVRYSPVVPGGTMYCTNPFGPGAATDGTALSILSAGSRGAVAYTLVSDPNALEPRISTLETSVAALDPTTATTLAHEQFTLTKQNFATLPPIGTTLGDTWYQGGGAWTASNGLVGPAGGWGTFFIWNYGASSIARRGFSAEIRSPSAADIFGICTQPLEGYGGAVAVGDRVNGLLRLYGWTGSGAGTLEPSMDIALPAGFASGARRYRLTPFLNDFTVTIAITDLLTGETVSSVGTHSSSTLSSFPLFHGFMGVMKLAGAPVFDSFEVVAPYRPNPLSVIVGDSLTDASGLFLPGQLPWSRQLAAGRNDIIVAGRSGDDFEATAGARNFASRQTIDLLDRGAEMAIIALGSNDLDIDRLSSNMMQLVSDCIARGIEPIPCTLPPRADRQAMINTHNARIRSGYYGRLTWIDFAYALSLNHDGVTVNPAYDAGDGVHQNMTGHAVRLARVYADVPRLRY